MKTAILHYSAAPVVGGVEAVIQAHADQFAAAGLPLTVIAGRGEAAAMPVGVEFMRIEEVDSLHPAVSAATAALDAGEVPASFDGLAGSLAGRLRPVVAGFDHLVIHNVLTKHFNLPLTAALFQLLDEGAIRHAIAWCHDLTWSSPTSRSRVYPSRPWTLLKTIHDRVTYVAVSEQRRKEVAETFGCPQEAVHVVYNGVDPSALYGLSAEGAGLVERLDLLSADLVLLMPVRVTQAKNIEFALELVAALKGLGCRLKLVLTGPPDPHDPASMEYYRSLLALRRQLGVEKEMHFVHECGPNAGQGYTIGPEVVADLYRVADAMLMTSHREGFGMPVMEAGLLGLPVISTPVPAASEIAGGDALVYAWDAGAQQLAAQVLDWLQGKPEHRLRLRVRRNYTWRSIFENEILPLLQTGDG